MKRCQFCGERATIHLTEIREDGRKQMHLCEGCGVEQKLVSNEAPAQLNLPQLLQLLLGEAPATAARKSKPETAALTCSCCGLKYAQFRTAGRFGCPDDYHVFHEPLTPLLERIHRGLEHVGKRPKRIYGEQDLREQLQAAIQDENFELAAQLRDRLRRKDTDPG
jgi:protein arginine kinase activator